MIVISVAFRFIPRYANKGLSGNELESEATETPYINGSVNLSSQDQLRRSRPKWGDELLRKISEAKCYSKQT
jgi:hypothetical protein